MNKVILRVSLVFLFLTACVPTGEVATAVPATATPPEQQMPPPIPAELAEPDIFLDLESALNKDPSSPVEMGFMVGNMGGTRFNELHELAEGRFIRDQGFDKVTIDIFRSYVDFLKRTIGGDVYKVFTNGQGGETFRVTAVAFHQQGARWRMSWIEQDGVRSMDPFTAFFEEDGLTSPEYRWVDLPPGVTPDEVRIKWAGAAMQVPLVYAWDLDGAQVYGLNPVTQETLSLMELWMAQANVNDPSTWGGFLQAYDRHFANPDIRLWEDATEQGKPSFFARLDAEHYLLVDDMAELAFIRHFRRFALAQEAQADPQFFATTVSEAVRYHLIPANRELERLTDEEIRWLLMVHNARKNSPENPQLTVLSVLEVIDLEMDSKAIVPFWADAERHAYGFADFGSFLTIQAQQIPLFGRTEDPRTGGSLDRNKPFILNSTGDHVAVLLLPGGDIAIGQHLRDQNYKHYLQIVNVPESVQTFGPESTCFFIGAGKKSQFGPSPEITVRLFLSPNGSYQPGDFVYPEDGEAALVERLQFPFMVFKATHTSGYFDFNQRDGFIMLLDRNGLPNMGGSIDEAESMSTGALYYWPDQWNMP